MSQKHVKITILDDYVIKITTKLRALASLIVLRQCQRYDFHVLFKSSDLDRDKFSSRAAPILLSANS